MSGVVVVQSKGELHHQGITLTMDGTVSLQLSAKNVGMFEAFYRSIKVWYGTCYLRHGHVMFVKGSVQK